MQRQRHATGTVWENSFSYSRAVRVGADVRVSGTTATGPDGSVIGVGDAGEQARYILDKIGAALAAVGATPDDVVRTRMYVTDIGDAEAVGRVHGAVFAVARPASTMVEVAKLILPEMLVEIEVDAIVA